MEQHLELWNKEVINHKAGVREKLLLHNWTGEDPLVLLRVQLSSKNQVRSRRVLLRYPMSLIPSVTKTIAAMKHLGVTEDAVVIALHQQGRISGSTLSPALIFVIKKMEDTRQTLN